MAGGVKEKQVQRLDDVGNSQSIGRSSYLLYWRILELSSLREKLSKFRRARGLADDPHAYLVYAA